jgi:SAM-dependent methyltransferase
MDRKEMAQAFLKSARTNGLKEAQGGFYPHVNRSLEEYRLLIPGLDSIVMQLLKAQSSIHCLDAGCGTGRAAAELGLTYPNVEVTGVTLVKYPPLPNQARLPDERIIESSIGEAPFMKEQFNLILAVGSIDVSNTIVQEGEKLLELTAKQGFFIFAPTSIFEGNSHCEELEGIARESGIKVASFMSNYQLPVYIFHKP